MKPNIFFYATKELSQDAFIAWLIAWGDDKYLSVEKELCQGGKKFIHLILEKSWPHLKETISNVDVGKQWKGIDIWAKINSKYLIIIEDKTSSSQHSNQLIRYKEIAQKWCLEQTPKYHKPVCIYLKTGNESLQSLSQVKSDGFEIFDRNDFLKILNNKNISNDIFKDFKDRMLEVERSNREWENKILNQWSFNDWQGFYQYLEKEMNVIGWNYVNNPSGGFWNCVLNWNYWKIYPLYLQIEQFKLCFKISADPAEPVILPPDETLGSIRNKASKLILNSAQKMGIFDIKKPSRFGVGKYMTVAVIERENWLGDLNKEINKENVIDNLQKFKRFLIETINENP